MKCPAAAHLEKLKVLLCAVALMGCVQHVPTTSDAWRMDTGYTAPTQRIPIRVGLYVRDDVRDYSYRWSKLGMILQLDAGEYLLPLSMELASAHFRSTTRVDSLPPYTGESMPDVDAVMEPEIIYFYTDSTGALSGQVESKVGIRMNLYDLSGNTIWQGQAVGEVSSARTDFLYLYFHDRDQVGELVHQAMESALLQLANELRSRQYKEIYQLSKLEPVHSSKPSKGGQAGSQDEAFFRQGSAWVERRNYQQALRSFLRAEAANPNEPYAKFYIGVCDAYSGERQKALDKFREIAGRKGDSKLQADTQKWIETLSQPLKIGLVVMNGDGAGFAETLYGRFGGSSSYQVIRLDSRGFRDLKNRGAEFNPYLDRLRDEGIRIVVFLKPEKTAMAIEPLQGLAGESASDFLVSIAVEAYSTKHKKLHSQFTVSEKSARMVGPVNWDHHEIFRSMFEKASQRALLKLLENNVI